MKRETYHLEIITPCFCAGADQSKAEIRAPSIRGQLRWWFRVLGGFKSLAGQSLRDQETLLFGAASGGEGVSGALSVRVASVDLKTSRKDGQQLGHENFSDPAFLTFPLQSREKNDQKTSDASRGVIDSGKFDITILCRSPRVACSDIEALMSVFGSLGSMGFRSRRAMGAIHLSGPRSGNLASALGRFNCPESIVIKMLGATSAKNAISVLGAFLRLCRSHGRSGQNSREQESPYFNFAKNDHDIGYNMRDTLGAPAFRPALGLPIIQRTAKGTNNWEYDQDPKTRKPEGRFASPVLLRPHKDADGKWRALVIFVDSMRWPSGKQVFLNGQPRTVSLDLYNAMKSDPALTPFP